MARKFLYVIAGLIVLVLTGAFMLNIFQEELTEMAFVPQAKFTEQKALEQNVYARPDMWYSRGQATPGASVNWQPTGAPELPPGGPAAVFFVHPTSYISKDSWNAPLGNQEAEDRARIFLKGLASPFASSGDIWAPKYRQATVGAFLTEKPAGQQALDAAYEDVLQSFDKFLEEIGPKRPLILAGHSQGARHLTHLLQDRVKGKALAKRIIAVYSIGWPISVEADLEELGLPACASEIQTGCIISYQSFAEPADYQRIVDVYGTTTGFNGQPRKDTSILCTNPLNGGTAPDAAMEMNLGTLKPNADLSQGELVPGAVPARCDEKGFLLIGDPPKLGPYVLPGNNYHVYDIPLFWANLRIDALKRTRAFLSP